MTDDGFYNDGDIDWHNANYDASAPRCRDLSDVVRVRVEMQLKDFRWVSIGIREVTLQDGEWYLAGQDRIVCPAGTKYASDGYRFQGHPDGPHDDTRFMTDA